MTEKPREFSGFAGRYAPSELRNGLRKLLQRNAMRGCAAKWKEEGTLLKQEPVEIKAANIVEERILKDNRGVHLKSAFGILQWHLQTDC